MKLRVKNDRQLNMAIDRRKYINDCNDWSDTLVEHILKLYMFKSPNDIQLWLNTVAKSLDVETSKLKGNWTKPIYEHIDIITDEDGESLYENALEARIDSLNKDKDYLKLPRNPFMDVYGAWGIIKDLIDRLDPKYIYTKDEIKTLVKWWWEANKWY